jgi:AcrR family transcriptional regulator
VSQGALFKYHDSKPALLAATVGYLFDGLVRDFEAAFSLLPDRSQSLDEAFELLWNQMLDERLWAAYELYTAARTNPALQADLGPVVAAHSQRIFELAGPVFRDTGVGQYGAVTSLAICAIQGLLINQMACPNPAEIGLVHRALRAYAASLSDDPIEPDN